MEVEANDRFSDGKGLVSCAVCSSQTIAAHDVRARAKKTSEGKVPKGLKIPQAMGGHPLSSRPRLLQKSLSASVVTKTLWTWLCK